MGRVAAAAVLFVIIGLCAGYWVWGARASSLGQSLDILTLEYDALRARSESGGGIDGSMASAIEALSARLHEQGEQLGQQALMLAQLTGGDDEQSAESLRQCDEAQVRIQEQLESCLFSRAELERSAAAAKREATPPRRGTQTVSETIELPPTPAPGTKLNPPKLDKKALERLREKAEAAAEAAKAGASAPGGGDVDP